MSSPLTEAGYVPDEVTNVWLRPGYCGIDYSDGDEVEERIATIINEATDLSVLSSELRPHCTDWPSLYHLTSARANILRLFETNLRGDVLEIGAGCGAITRFLGECGGNVLALEGSPRRAAIAKSRVRDLTNVAVVSDKFNQFRDSRKFDVVTLIGVLEYANLFNSDVNPALCMLEQVHSLLKPDGKLIIAIENQFGLKYFAGAPEDHLSIPMYGIEGRYRREQPQTFGRQALTKVLAQAGFACSEFLAPFPDYKLPCSIVNEKGFACDDFDAAALAWQSVRRDPQLPPIMAFSPELVWQNLVENGLALDLSNSFLIVASSDDRKFCSNSSILAWHFTSERSKEFCKKIEFTRSDTGDMEVHCKPLLSAAATQCETQLLSWSISEISPYVTGRSLARELIDIVSLDGWKIEDVGRFLKRYLKLLATLIAMPGKATEITAADYRISGGAFDYIPQNIIVSADGGYHVIDKEWALNTDITAGQLVFRGLLAMMGLVTRYGSTTSDFANTPLGFISAAFRAIGFSVTESEVIQYLHWEMATQCEVSGTALNTQDRIDWFSSYCLPRENLSRAVAERNGRITSLNQVVAERDTKLESLNQVVVERDGQITGLSQEVAERDAQIESLNQVVVERDEQITDLKQAVAELDQTVRDILGSTSWRITMPMRAMSHRLRSGTGRESKSGGNSSTWRLVGKLLRQPIRLGQSGMRTIKTGVRILRFVADKAVEWRTVNQRWPAPTELPRLVRSLMRLHVAQSFAETLNPKDLDALRTRLDECSDALPSISVVMPVYRTPIDLLRRAIVSVLDQIFWKWELCICDDGSANDELQKELEHWAEKDPRIRIYTLTQNSGISKATNIAIEHATGDYIAFLDHDDEFTPDALAEVALVIAENSSVDVVYSDQDKIDSRGIAFEQFHKPDWSPDYFRRVMYVGHLLVVRRSLVDAVNGFDSRFDRVQDYEFMLRVSEKSSHIMHIQKILYHWRATRGSIAASADAKGKIEELQSEAVRQHIQRIGLKGDVFPNPAFPHRVSIHYKTPAANEKVSIVIPSKDHPEHIGRCLASIYDNSKDKNVEVVVVDNGTSDPDALQILRKYPVQVVLYDEPFNYSKANNIGVAASSGSIVVLLNNDTEVISPDWLDILIGHLDQKDVGAVGPVLLYPDSTVQHAGIVLGPRGTADHVMRGFQADWDGYAGTLSCVREVTAVTGACLLTRRETYEQLGGMVEHYATHYQDVDFCLRLRKKGLRILCVPDSKLIHYESVTRGSDYDVLDRLLLQDIWAQELRSGDPYFNPAFSLAKLDYSLATNR